MAEKGILNMPHMLDINAQMAYYTSTHLILICRLMWRNTLLNGGPKGKEEFRERFTPRIRSLFMFLYFLMFCCVKFVRSNLHIFCLCKMSCFSLPINSLSLSPFARFLFLSCWFVTELQERLKRKKKTLLSHPITQGQGVEERGKSRSRKVKIERKREMKTKAKGGFCLIIFTFRCHNKLINEFSSSVF